MGALDVAPRDWTTNEVVTAGMLNAEIRDKWNVVQGAWQSYTPTLTATTSPTLGTGGSIFGKYMQIGKTVFYQGTAKFGTSGVVSGSGTYSISMPVTAPSQAQVFMGTGMACPNGTIMFPCHLNLFTATMVFYAATSTTATNVTLVNNSGAGGTGWGANGFLKWSVQYEAA